MISVAKVDHGLYTMKSCSYTVVPINWM